MVPNMFSGTNPVSSSGGDTSRFFSGNPYMGQAPGNQSNLGTRNPWMGSQQTNSMGGAVSPGASGTGQSNPSVQSSSPAAPSGIMPGNPGENWESPPRPPSWGPPVPGTGSQNMGSNIKNDTWYSPDQFASALGANPQTGIFGGGTGGSPTSGVFNVASSLRNLGFGNTRGWRTQNPFMGNNQPPNPYLGGNSGQGGSGTAYPRGGGQIVIGPNGQPIYTPPLDVTFPHNLPDNPNNRLIVNGDSGSYTQSGGSFYPPGGMGTKGGWSSAGGGINGPRTIGKTIPSGQQNYNRNLDGSIDYTSPIGPWGRRMT